jgi:hypothetical protein
MSEPTDLNVTPYYSDATKDFGVFGVRLFYVITLVFQ